MSLPCIKEMNQKISSLAASSNLDMHEKTLLLLLSSLLDYMHLSVIKFNEPEDLLNAEIRSIIDEDKSSLYIYYIDDIKTELIKELRQNYNEEDFQVLSVNTFDQSSQFISSLIKNFLFYFPHFQLEENSIHIYYYLFHLIYFILLLIVNSKATDVFDNKYVKFYIFHIIHFFQNDKKSIEFNFFFYEGSFRFLSKTFKISFHYLFELNNYFLKYLISMDDLLQIINIYWSTINRRKNKGEFELNFLGNITQKKMQLI